MRKIWSVTKKCKVTFISFSLLCFITLTACGKSDPIIGTWVSDSDDDMVVFEEDGSCLAPFTYNSSWIESADRYTLTEDGTLVLSSEGGHANDSFAKADSEEEALEKHNTYYVSGDTLIIDGDTYIKAE